MRHVTEIVRDRITPDQPVRSSILARALAAGAVLGVIAKLLGGFAGPLALLGVGVALWVTAGFLVARHAARGRGVLDGTVWAGTTMAVYLSAWLLAYCVVFGLQQSAGFGAAWLNERVFFIIAPLASALIGFLAAISWRRDWLGDVFLAAPIAWSLPEVGYSLLQGWRFAAIVALPTLLVACVPLGVARRRRNWTVVAAACVAGGVIAFLLMRAIVGRM